MKEAMRKYAKYLLPFSVAVLIFALITDFDKTIAQFSFVFKGLTYILSRFIIGFGLAYMLNFLVRFLQKKTKMRLGLAVALSYVAFFGLIAVMLLFIIPMIIESVTTIIGMAQQVPDYYAGLQAWLVELMGGFGEAEIAYLLDILARVGDALLRFLEGLIDLSTIESVLRGSTRTILNLFFGVVVSVYALLEKDKILRLIKRSMYALFPPRKTDGALRFLRESHKVFSQFLVGKLLDSAIIGVASAIIYVAVRMPQAGFMAILAGVFNMVPYFGPIAGGALSVAIMLFFDPVYALYMLIIYVVLQAIDGWFLGPKILGDAVGISPLLTIIAIALGGDIAGFFGIFLGVPTMAVIKTVVFDRWMERRLQTSLAAVEESGEDVPDHVRAEMEALAAPVPPGPERAPRPARKPRTRLRGKKDK